MRWLRSIVCLTPVAFLAFAVVPYDSAASPVEGEKEGTEACDQRPGCCSRHGGVCGCRGGRALCCDNSLSPSCGCD
jgi:hypothetical protein